MNSLKPRINPGRLHAMGPSVLWCDGRCVAWLHPGQARRPAWAVAWLYGCTGWLTTLPPLSGKMINASVCSIRTWGFKMAACTRVKWPARARKCFFCYCALGKRGSLKSGEIGQIFEVKFKWEKGREDDWQVLAWREEQMWRKLEEIGLERHITDVWLVSLRHALRAMPTIAPSPTFEKISLRSVAKVCRSPLSPLLVKWDGSRRAIRI